MTTNLFRPLKTAVAAALVAVALAPVGAKAQDFSDSHLKAARAAIASIEATDQFDRILLVAADQLKTRLITSNPNLDEEITNVVEDEALKLVPRRADLENEAARAYAAAFTEEQLTQIAEFYESEAGQKLIETGPIVTREVQRSAQVWARGIERDLMSAVAKRLNDELSDVNTNIEVPQQDIPAPETTTPQN